MDTKLKQRLIGGAVLIALAVIFLPMLVHGPAPDSGVGDVSTRVPDAPAGKFETRELQLGPAAGQTALPAPAASAVTPAEPSAAADEAAADAPARAAAVPADPDVAAGQWAVSFGAYASTRDADAVLSRLRQAGLEGFKEEAQLNGRQAWRVRVGPYLDRALAEAGRLQAVRIRNDVNAQVIALDAGADAAPAAASATARPAPAPAVVPAATPAVAKATPEPTAPVEAKPTPRPAAASVEPPKVAPATPAAATPAPRPSAPAASDVGFAVQLGAFASQAEAHALRDRLRAAGFSAIVQPVPTAKGTLNRVRVGPVATRAEAEQLKSRLAAGFGNGNVVQHP